MIAFDTHVLVSLLVEDDPEQFAAATSVLEQAAGAGERCHLAHAVLCETVWVLTSLYGARRHGARTTYSFDRKLRHREGFTYLR